MEKTFLIVTSGEDHDDTGALFIQAESPNHAFIKFLTWNGSLIIETKDEFENFSDPMLNSQLEDLPIGVAEIDLAKVGDFTNVEIEWYFDYNDEHLEYPEMWENLSDVDDDTGDDTLTPEEIINNL